MTYTYDPSKGLEPLPGLPLEADDKAFEAAVAIAVGRGAAALTKVQESGIYKHTPDKATGSKAEG